MNRWDDLNALVELLDRQFAYLQDLSGTLQLIRVGRVLGFLYQDARTAAVLKEMRLESERILEIHHRRDVRAREGLKKSWDARVAVPAFFDDVSTFGLRIAAALENLEPFDLGYDEPHARHIETLGLIDALIATCGPTNDRPDRASFVAQLKRSRVHLEHRGQRLRSANKGLPWAAFLRLCDATTLHNPAPPRGADPDEWAVFEENRRLADFLMQAEEDGLTPMEVDPSALAESVRSDARLLHEELRFRLGLVRSNVTLVQRYAHRCGSFDARRLRRACDENSGSAERLLTLDLARYLFDAGLNPIIDATIGGLKPDLVHVQKGTLFYVEAKQYADDYPGSMLRKAYRQVWGTWAHLRKTHSVPEAFLVVFRRAGPWVDLPDVIHHEGLRLYSVVVDISEEGGSAEKRSPISLTAQELSPESAAD